MPTTAATGARSNVTGLVDDGPEFLYDSYDGPDISPPPYEG